MLVAAVVASSVFIRIKLANFEKQSLLWKSILHIAATWSVYLCESSAPNANNSAGHCIYSSVKKCIIFI